MRGPEGMSTDRRGDRTRRRVLEATLAVLRERPLADVQLQHIATRVGISPGHVLYHFGSKDRILVETLRWSEAEIARAREVELRTADDPRRQLEIWIRLFLPRDAQDPTWKLWLEFWMRSAMDEELRDIPRAMAERWMVDFGRIVDEGVTRGAFHVLDRSRLGTWAHSLLIGLSIEVLACEVSLADAQSIALESIGKELGAAAPL